MPAKKRCAWAKGDEMVVRAAAGSSGEASLRMVRYHDEEWGVPVRDDVTLFELLTLEGAQAGLSWSTVLAKREGYRKAFASFDPERVSRYTAEDVRRLLANAGIIRHRGKIEGTIANARALVDLRRQGTTFTDFVWSFVHGRPIQNVFKRRHPAETEISRAMSKALRAQGFTFVGPTICYAFMQAAGLVNDHTTDCFRWRELR